MLAVMKFILFLHQFKFFLASLQIVLSTFFYITLLKVIISTNSSVVYWRLSHLILSASPGALYKMKTYTGGEWEEAISLSAWNTDFVNLSIYVVPKRTGTTNSFTTPKLMWAPDFPVRRCSVIVSDNSNFVSGALQICGMLSSQALSSHLVPDIKLYKDWTCTNAKYAYNKAHLQRV